jgi:dipeptidyl aminopeptidase/acylaminoacyl peptidase
MKKNILPLLAIGLLLFPLCNAQNVMTPELLWKLGRVSGETLSPDGKTAIFGITYYDVAANKGEENLYSVPIVKEGTAKTGDDVPKQLTTTIGAENNVQFSPAGKMGYLYKGNWYEANPDGSGAVKITNDSDGIDNVKYSPDGKWVLFTKNVKLDQMESDLYPNLPKAHARIFNDLMYRHWNFWEDGTYSHVFYAPYSSGKIDMSKAVDIMKMEHYYCPTQPDGGAECMVWSPDSKTIVYVTKEKVGKDYAISTNTDLYFYELASGNTTDFTQDNPGYDQYPVFSPDGSKIAWLSMARDGYEADKNRIMVYDFKTKTKTDVTKDWDESAGSLLWSKDNTKLFFTENAFGTDQLFEITIPKEVSAITSKDFRQVTKGDFDVTAMIGQSGNNMVVTRTDMNHAAELYKVDLKTGEFTQLTFTNKAAYDKIHIGNIEKRWVTTTDNKKELVWVIYPPDFDATKKYPTLLYCQGGPQSTVSQFYSFRWNFQLMAANGYIIVAPCRRGMPGFGVAWNAEISRDWGGQPMRDYLSAIDSISKLPFVDVNRRGAVGASYGGYSIYFLAGIHNGRFKTFIAHDGVFDLESMYGTTEELWFNNWEMGGSYWDKPEPVDYQKFNPKNYVDKWNTPILIIHGQQDFRVPVEQGIEAYQAAQLKGIKSRFLYLDDEGHWVLKPQDGLVWQHEFYRWLDETLKN